MNQTSSSMDVAVVGVGRMGGYHARTYNKLPQANLVAVVDHDLDRAETVADEYGCAAFQSTDELLARHPTVQAVSVAVPTVYHRPAAESLIKQGISCLIEKPLAQDTEEAKALVDLAEAHGVTLQVGHTERFNPAVRAVAAMNINTRFMEVHRVSPMTFRSLDIGVVMDMMIHDLDIVLAFAASPLKQVDATGVAVLGNHEDVANARLVFESGCVANVTASRLALKTERRMRLFSEDAYVNLDYQNRTGLVLRNDSNAAQLEEVRKQLANGGDLSSLNYHELINLEELNMDVPKGEEDPLTAELTSFLHATETGSPAVVDGAAGFAAVDAAERVVKAIGEHRWEGLSAPTF